MRTPSDAASARSIPAYAGKPPDPIARQYLRRVYPRMRGSREAWLGGRRPRGSIPAHAGEPRYETMTAAPSRVYPRPCGGAASGLWTSGPGDGLSPPMRGSRLIQLLRSDQGGSIPAHRKVALLLDLTGSPAWAGIDRVRQPLIQRPDHEGSPAWAGIDPR